MRTIKHSSRKVGVEFEFASDYDQEQVATIITDTGMPAISKLSNVSGVPDGYDIAVEDAIAFRFDPGYKRYKLEAKTRILSGINDWREQVGLLLDTLRPFSEIDPRAVYHVNLDLPEIADDPTKIISLINLWYTYQNVLYALVFPEASKGTMTSYRINHALCQQCKAASGDVDACKMLMARWSDVRGINIQPASLKHPRVEIRIAEGTLDFDKATRWYRLMAAMTDHAMRNDVGVADILDDNEDTLTEFIDLIGYEGDRPPLLHKVITDKCMSLSQPQLLAGKRAEQRDSIPQHVDITHLKRKRVLRESIAKAKPQSKEYIQPTPRINEGSKGSKRNSKGCSGCSRKKKTVG